ncbi:MAG TPA: hypothetical protein VIW92_12560 [Thermoanaerobaculia bacterium]
MKQEGSVQKSAMANPANQTEEIRRRPDIERVLAGLAGVEGRLKAERVEQVLQLMPGWEQEKGGRAITRLREFEDAPAAAKYAAYVQDYAGSRSVTISTLRWDQFVLVTLLGQRRRRSFDFLNADALRFAVSLG